MRQCDPSRQREASLICYRLRNPPHSANKELLGHSGTYQLDVWTYQDLKRRNYRQNGGKGFQSVKNVIPAKSYEKTISTRKIFPLASSVHLTQQLLSPEWTHARSDPDPWQFDCGSTKEKTPFDRKQGLREEGEDIFLDKPLLWQPERRREHNGEM